MKRIFLLVATNVAVLVVLSITLRLLGVDRILDERGTGLDLTALLIFSAVLGFGGSLISLAMSKFIAKRAMGVRVIDQPRDAAEAWLVETVRRQAQAAGIGMPEVGVFDTPDMNAFATGPRKNNALVAVSAGLLRGMSRREAEAVLGHEISHVANGDMVTLTLIQGVVNTFVIFLSRVIVMWFSRQREFRADAGGAKLEGREPMIAALERLRQQHPHPLPDQMAAFGISGTLGHGLKRLFMTHPPLEERIAALRAL
jgi:heat shock protein HtpX